MSLSSVLAALSLLAPQDGAVVQTRTPVRLAWQGPAEAVYLVSVWRAGGANQTTSVSNRTDIYVANLDLGARFDWTVRQAGTLDEATAHFETDDNPPRLLRADGVFNFRDMGGWRTSDGRRVRQNVLLRSAALRTLARGGENRQITDAGVAALQAEFGIRTDIDLRSKDDIRGSALGGDVRWRRIPFASGRGIDHAVRGREPFARIFDLLSDRQNHPLLFEASDDGREADALGFLLNGLLGVTEEDLRRGWTSSPVLCQEMSDYLKTLPGKTLAQRIEVFARGCGIRSEEIEAFRTLMLEPETENKE